MCLLGRDETALGARIIAPGWQAPVKLVPAEIRGPQIDKAAQIQRYLMAQLVRQAYHVQGQPPYLTRGRAAPCAIVNTRLERLQGDMLPSPAEGG